MKHPHGYGGMKPPLADADKGGLSLYIIHALKCGASGKQLRLHIDLAAGAEYFHGITGPLMAAEAFSREKYRGKQFFLEKPFCTGT